MPEEGENGVGKRELPASMKHVLVYTAAKVIIICLPGFFLGGGVYCHRIKMPPGDRICTHELSRKALLTLARWMFPMFPL